MRIFLTKKKVSDICQNEFSDNSNAESTWNYTHSVLDVKI